MNRKDMINIRGIAILAVVSIHITADSIVRGAVSVDTLGNLIINTLSRFAVPVFFISSGYGISLSFDRYRNVSDFYKSRLKIIPEFIFWSLIFFVVSGHSFGFKSILELVTGQAYYHLYFIPALLICYFIYPFVIKIFNTKYKLLLFTFIMMTVPLLHFYGINLAFVGLIGYIPYFSVGILLEKNRNLLENLLKYDLLIFLVGSIWLFGSTLYYFIYTNKSIGLVTTGIKPAVFMYSVGILLVFTRRFSVPGRILTILDRNSLTIYYAHPIFLVLISRALARFDIVQSGVLIVTLKLIVIVILSLGVSILKEKIIEKFERKDTSLV